MTPLNLITDGYERKARLYPALLLIAPIVITIVGVASTKLSTLESFATVLAGCGGAFLLTQLARDAGKKQEAILRGMGRASIGRNLSPSGHSDRCNNQGALSQAVVNTCQRHESIFS
ncbi:MAG: hypothetical protein WDN23_05880 [Edaphobacter sp.]